MAQQRTRSRQPGGAEVDPIELLTTDHQKVKALFQEFEAAEAGEEKRRLFGQIKMELKVHSKIEEEIFYPAVHEIDSEIASEAVEEHNVVDWILAQMTRLSPDNEAYDAKFKTLRENVEHHMEEEETEMFAEARQALGSQLGELGALMMERKKKLMSQAEGRSRRGGSTSRTGSGRGRRAG
jgi:hypothetical protein